MSLSKKEILYAKLNSIKTTIEKSSEVQKKEQIAIHLMDSFNELISETAKSYPDLKDSLPKPITSGGVNHRLKKADVNYLDLEINTEIILSLLNLIEK